MTKQHIKELQKANAHKLQPRAPEVTKWIAPKNYRPYKTRTTTLKPHGAKEMERRKRQIDYGQLKVENGLVV